MFDRFNTKPLERNYTKLSFENGKNLRKIITKVSEYTAQQSRNQFRIESGTCFEYFRKPFDYVTANSAQALD
jgi:hypothetical protein